MKTKYTIYEIDGSSKIYSDDWPNNPPYRMIADLIRPILGGAELEHV